MDKSPLSCKQACRHADITHRRQAAGQGRRGWSFEAGQIRPKWPHVPRALAPSRAGGPAGCSTCWPWQPLTASQVQSLSHPFMAGPLLLVQSAEAPSNLTRPSHNTYLLGGDGSHSWGTFWQGADLHVATASASQIHALAACTMPIGIYAEVLCSSALRYLLVHDPGRSSCRHVKAIAPLLP